MAGDLKTQIAVGVDGSGVTAGVENIKNTLDSMGKKAAAVGKQASEGIDRIGDGAAPTAAKVDTAAKNMIGSIQRQIAAMEAGSKSGADYYRVLAGQRGIDTSVLAPYLAQLDAVAAKQKAALQAGGSQNTQGDAVIAGLREQIRALGMTSDELLKYKAAQAGVGATAAPLILQLQNMRAAQEAAAQAARDEARAQREVAAAQAGRTSFLAGLQSQAESIGKTRSQLLEMQAAQMGLTSQAAPFIAKLREAEAGVGKMGVSAGQTAQAMRQLPAQFSDVIVSLQGGQNPISVLLQQGSQLKDSFGGVGAAAGAMGTYIASLVNPLTLGAAALGIIAYAAYEGSKEMTAYSKALILTGNASGKTAGDLEALARQIAATTGTQGQAADALVAAVSSGKIASSALESVGAASVAMSRTLGISIDDAVGQFAKLSGEPAKAAAELNKQYHFLSASTYARIRDLDDQGQKEQATAVAQQAYADATVARMRQVQEQAGILSRALGGVGDVASGMWRTIAGAVSSIGAQKTSAAQLAEAQRMVDFLNQNGGTPERKAQAQADLATASENDRLNRRSALVQFERQRGEEEKQAAIDRWANQRKSNRTQAEIRKELIDQTIADGKLLGKAQKDIDAEIAKINENHKDKKPAAVKAYQDDAGTKYLQDLREQEAAAMRRLVVGEKLTGAAKDLAEFEQKIADLKDKGTLTKDQKDLVARQGEIRGLLQEIALLEKLGVIEDEEAKKKVKLAQEAVAFQDRAAQLQEQIASAQAERREGYGRALGAFGKSDFEQQRIQEINGLYRESLRLQDQLTKATPKSQLGSENYLAEIASIKSALGTSLADHATYYAELKRLQGDWSLGAQSALATYAEDSANVARQMQQAVGGAFKGMEDQLVSFVTTGKADFKSLANSIISDIVRITIRQSITGPLASALGGLFGGVTGGVTGSVAKNALGGVYQSPSLSAYSNQVYDKPQLFAFAKGAGVFGEAGPEAIMPLRRGADGRLGVAAGGGMGKIEVNIQNNVGAAKAEVKQTPTPDGGMRIDVVFEAFEEYLADKIGAGAGPATRAMEGRFGLRTAVT